VNADRRVEVIERTVVFRGFFKLVRYRLRHSLFGGGMSPVLERELFDRGHAAVVLPYDPVREEVVLVEQFRPGEAAEEVARREAQEEAGLELLDLVPIGSYFPSPGASSEICAAYVARIDSRGAGGLFGLAGHGEDVKAHVVPLATALAWLEDGTLRAASALITLQWLALHRSALRARWELAAGPADEA